MGSLLIITRKILCGVIKFYWSRSFRSVLFFIINKHYVPQIWYAHGLVYLYKFTHTEYIKAFSRPHPVRHALLCLYVWKQGPDCYYTFGNFCLHPYSWNNCFAISHSCDYLQYIPRNMLTVFALLCFVVVIHWLIYPYPSGLLHWHCGNLTIVPVPAKQPWWIWINTSCEFIMNDCITTTKQSTTKPCAYFLGYTVAKNSSRAREKSDNWDRAAFLL